MHKFLVLLCVFGFAAQSSHAFATLPDNPIAFGNCQALVKVDAARLRTGPSLDSKVVGIRIQHDSLFVNKVVGKWVQVVLTNGDTAYVAAYLLSFPAADILEQWKRESPSPSVGKKAKVKWAQVNFRKYPAAHAPLMGHFTQEDDVSVLTDLGNGWSLVEGGKPDGSGSCYGFITTSALTRISNEPAWGETRFLALVKLNPGETLEPEKTIETPAQYCLRTAWSPELFELELNAKAHSSDELLAPHPNQLVAIQ